jgi:hypothetical protein
MYTVQFQKKLFSHADILLWLDGQNKLTYSIDIDNVMSFEMLHLNLYSCLHSAATMYMIHGRGFANLKSLCMNRKKSKKFQFFLKKLGKSKRD